jgi:uncharacterized UBP type Zn finger protein
MSAEVECMHLESIVTGEANTPGCEECEQAGESWTHLRRCTTCGHVGCCDSSRRKHATRHYRATGHPIMQSHEPGESWYWCYPDRRIVEL